tara:strand:- start:1941 stop:3431 length:1491 start_codon:yes stop_codon:yes gene_type:complete
MGLIQSSKGRFDETLTNVMNDIRQPVFVDNAVHYAKVEPRSAGKTRVTIEAINADNYDLATERTYSLVESESSIIITHTETDGHSLKSDVWSSNGKNTVTDLLYSEDNPVDRIMKSTVTSTSNGLQLDLRNMKGRTLKDIGFRDERVHLAQGIDIGFRTTDLAVRLAQNVPDAITAVTTGSHITTTRGSNNRRKVSNTFLASDFYGINLITALRFVSRHDNRVTMMNRYGVLNYVPFNHADVSRKIAGNIRFGQKKTNPIENIENRVTVQGKQIALNEDLILTMDDRSRQQSKYNTDVLESVTPIFDESITSISRAKTVARQILKANASTTGSLQSRGHPNLWDARPGDIIEYDGKRLTILEAQHRAGSALSDFTFLSVESGLEGVLQGIESGSVSSSSKRRPDKTNQITDENFSFFDSLKIIVTPTITVTELSHAGFLIGGNSDRGRLGGAITVGTARKKLDIANGVLVSDTATNGTIQNIGLIEKESTTIEGES